MLCFEYVMHCTLIVKIKIAQHKESLVLMTILTVQYWLERKLDVYWKAMVERG